LHKNTQAVKAASMIKIKNNYAGWVNLWKPEGISSMQAVAAVRRLTGTKKAGHIGTLDPLAEGLLPIALGEATKLIHLLEKAHKTYVFTVQWGTQTTTDDREGEAVHTSANRPSANQIEAILPQFMGPIQQTPPIFSAIKVNGQRAYAMARAGLSEAEIGLKSREVQIFEFKLVSHATDFSVFEVHCGAGTYVRSLARDMGQILGCYGYVTKLIRTKVGLFGQESKISLETLEENGYSAPEMWLAAPQTGLDDIPALALQPHEVQQLRHGMPLNWITKQDSHRLPHNPNPTQPLVALAFDGHYVAALVQVVSGKVQPLRVLHINQP
jgi:tRNA pseudouridine55 synthase